MGSFWFLYMFNPFRTAPARIEDRGGLLLADVPALLDEVGGVGEFEVEEIDCAVAKLTELVDRYRECDFEDR